MDDYGVGWDIAHDAVFEAQRRVVQEMRKGDALESFERLFRGELEQLRKWPADEKPLEGETLAGFQDGTRTLQIRLRKILAGEGDWEAKRSRISETLDELSTPPDQGGSGLEDRGEQGNEEAEG